MSNAVATLKSQVKDMRAKFAEVLPKDIDPDKFVNVVLSAIATNPDLQNADTSSFLVASMKCASDGLIPDGREAALVVQSDRKVRYMPMVAGLLKKCRNSGDIKSIGANVVYERDEWEYFIDDEGPHFKHRPMIDGDRGKARCAYAYCKTNDGGMYVEVLTLSDITKIQACSRGKGPWATWWEEMAKKSAIRRLSKRIPMSTEARAVVERDDDMYDFGEQRRPVPAGKSRLEAALAATQQDLEPEAKLAEVMPPADPEVPAEPPTNPADTII